MLSLNLYISGQAMQLSVRQILMAQLKLLTENRGSILSCRISFHTDSLKQGMVPQLQPWSPIQQAVNATADSHHQIPQKYCGRLTIMRLSLALEACGAQVGDNLILQ